MKKKYQDILPIILLGIITINTSADIRKELISNAKYSFESKITIVDSEQVNVKKAGLVFGIQSSATVAPGLELFGHLNLLFEEGSYLALNDDTFKIDNALYPSFLYLSYTPYYFFNSKVGIIKTARHFSPLLFNEPDLGVNNELSMIDFDYIKIKLIADAKLINNNLTESRTGSLSKTNSYYSNLGIDFEVLNHYVSSGFLFSKYNFNNPNYSMAQDSRFMGATVTGVSNSSVFTYEHLGDNFQFYISFNQLLEKMIFYSQYISNSDSQKNALIYGAQIGFLKNIKFIIEQYEIESDSILAIYSNALYGRTNRRGNHVSLNISDEKSSYSAHFYKNNTIKSNIFQDELTIFTLDFSYNF